MTQFLFDLIAERALQRVWMPTFDRRCPLEAVWIDAPSQDVADEARNGGARWL